jgi:hypothetical protein
MCALLALIATQQANKKTEKKMRNEIMGYISIFTILVM